MQFNTLFKSIKHREILTILSIAAIVASLAITGWMFVRNAFPPSTLPEPGPQPNILAQSLQTFMDAAAQNNGTPHMVREIRLDRRNRQRFKQHFTVIAARQGWYAFQENRSITLIIPAKDLPELETALNSPVKWTISQLRPSTSTPPPIPDADGLVKVHIRQAAQPNTREAFSLLGTSVSWLIAACLTLILASTIQQFITSTWRKSKQPTTTDGPSRH